MQNAYRRERRLRGLMIQERRALLAECHCPARVNRGTRDYGFLERDQPGARFYRRQPSRWDVD